MGIWPLTGRFTRFSGTLDVDPAHAEACAVRLDIEVASLAMDDVGRARLAVGPGLLDQQHFPTLTYVGSCAGGQSAGRLTLHGTTRPLQLSVRRQGRQVTATGSLRRADYGVDGMPNLIGRTIRLTFAVSLPEDVASLVSP